MTIEGKIHAIFDTVQISEKFRKREFVIDSQENPMYPQYLKFELIQDKCDILKGYKVGDVVGVTFNLKGREWTNPEGTKKYFNTLDAWRIAQVVTSGPKMESVALDMTADNPDDLPF